jgi:hypothetical protein
MNEKQYYNSMINTLRGHSIDYMKEYFEFKKFCNDDNCLSDKSALNLKYPYCKYGTIKSFLNSVNNKIKIKININECNKIKNHKVSENRKKSLFVNFNNKVDVININFFVDNFGLFFYYFPSSLKHFGIKQGHGTKNINSTKHIINLSNSIESMCVCTNKSNIYLPYKIKNLSCYNTKYIINSKINNLKLLIISTIEIHNDVTNRTLHGNKIIKKKEKIFNKLSILELNVNHNININSDTVILTNTRLLYQHKEIPKIRNYYQANNLFLLCSSGALKISDTFANILILSTDNHRHYNYGSRVTVSTIKFANLYEYIEIDGFTVDERCIKNVRNKAIISLIKSYNYDDELLCNESTLAIGATEYTMKFVHENLPTIRKIIKSVLE